MDDNVSTAPKWWLQNEGHVLAGVLVVRNHVNIEAHLLLDGTPLYRSRHSTRAVAEEELAQLCGQCARDGWIAAS